MILNYIINSDHLINMKKTISSWASMLIIVLLGGLSLTSCDRDDMQASELSGTWQGDFGMVFETKNDIWRAEFTVLEFHKKPFSNYGYGFQWDEFSARGCPIPYQRWEFDWSVKDGVITMIYPQNHDLDIEIYDYRMTSNYFSGRIGSSKEHFTLYKIDSWEWGNMGNSYYYAKERNTLDGVEQPSVEGTFKRVF